MGGGVELSPPVCPPPQRAPAAAPGRTRPEPRSAVPEHPRLRLCFPLRLPQPDFNAFSTRCPSSLGVFIFFLAVRGVQPPRTPGAPAPFAAGGLGFSKRRRETEGGDTAPWGGGPGSPSPSPGRGCVGPASPGGGGRVPPAGAAPGAKSGLKTHAQAPIFTLAPGPGCGSSSPRVPQGSRGGGARFGCGRWGRDFTPSTESSSRTEKRRMSFPPSRRDKQGIYLVWELNG